MRSPEARTSVVLVAAPGRALPEPLTRSLGTVTRLSDGLEALEYVFRTGRHSGREEDGPALLLIASDSDVVHGHEVARRVRAATRGEDIEVVIFESAPGGRIHHYVNECEPESGDGAMLENILRSGGLL